MSDHVQAETSEFAELSRLVKHLGEELASYRKRALSAEARLKSAEEQRAAMGAADPRRVVELERENGELRRRLDDARERTDKVLAKIRFLKQQRGEAQ